MKKKSKSKKIKFIPVNVPKIFREDKIYVKNSLNTNWISSEGPFVKKFEQEFSKFNKRKFGIAVSSGTAALEISLKALKLKPRDEIIIPAFSIISTALCVIKLGLRPVLVDCDLSTWNMIPEQIIKKINRRTKGIIITHIYGFPVDLEKIIKIAQKKNIKIIEDAAEMIGQKYKNRMCGSFGEASTFSFYANKHITSGEGGAVLTDDNNAYEKIKQIRNLDFNNSDRFKHENLFWNYRLSGIQAAFGNSSIRSIEKVIKMKIKKADVYNGLFSEYEDILQLPLTDLDGVKNHYWVYGIIPKIEFDRKKVMSMLLDKGIETRPFFFPLNLQPAYLNLGKDIFECPISEKIGKKGFYIPIGNHVSTSQQKMIVENITKLLV